MRLTHLYNWFQKLLRIARASVCAAAIVGVPPAFDIPMLDDIVVDGKHDDWQDQGLHVELVIPVSSDKAGDEEEEDLDVRFRLGWDERGLHLLIFVHDDVGIGSLYDHLLLEGDGVEFSVADEPGGRQIVHWSVGRPRKGDEAGLRTGFNDGRAEGELRKKHDQLTAVLESNPEGYVVEAMVPWSNVGVEPKIGHDIGFQLHVADLDDMGEVSHSVWYPAKGRIRNRTRMHRLRLAAEPGPVVTTIATVGDWDLFDDSPPEVKIEVTAIGGMVGKEVTVNQGKTTIARGLLDRQEGRAVASLTGSLPHPGDPYQDLVVLIDGVQATLVPLLKDIDAVAAKGAYEHLARVRVDVRAVPTLTGKSVLLRNDSGTILARGDLSMENGRASLTLRSPLPLPGEPLGETAVVVDDKYEVKITLPDLSFTRARSFVRENLVFRPHVFAWNEFPSCEFERPLYVERMIGPYTIDVTYYDKDYNVVTEALEPGRYGAVARIKTEAGRTFTRFSTLFRNPERLRWWRHKLEGSIKLPEELGIDPEVAIEQVKHVIEQMKRAFSNQTRRSDGPAKLLAGLYEMAPGQGEASVFEDPSARDRQWWLGLKRKLNGNDNRYGAFVCPRPIEGPPAPVLREGTLDEAGMKASAAERIDAHLTEWAGDTDEAFDVCVARHGVIVLHKAYGTRDGEPMTTHTKSYMASLTKLFSGTIMMMLVDQGLVDLDDTVDKFLPSLSGIEVETPATIQRLYTHTAGMWGHWGDHTNDFEHKVAECYPYLKIGKNRGYNGMSQALGSKIVEQLSGEALPIFYKKHLLDPLGCQDTDVTNSSYDAHSTARDMATIGQMLLNGGAYGDKRFFSEETFEKMLPRRLTKAIGPETEVVWGMGCYWAYDGATSDRTVTHGAASWATMRIDLKNDLVISMTRNSAGRNFHKYRLPFIQAVVEGMKGNGK